MIQDATIANDELRCSKLTRSEQEAQETRRHDAHSEHELKEQHQRTAHDFAQVAHSKLQHMKLQAPTEQAAAIAAPHALQATQSQIEGYHVEHSTLRGQLTDAKSRLASAAASEVADDTAKMIRGLTTSAKNVQP